MLEGKPIILKKISDPKFEEIKKIKEPNLMLKYAKFESPEIHPSHQKKSKEILPKIMKQNFDTHNL